MGFWCAQQLKSYFLAVKYQIEPGRGKEGLPFCAGKWARLCRIMQVIDERLAQLRRTRKPITEEQRKHLAGVRPLVGSPDIIWPPPVQRPPTRVDE